MKFVLAVVTLFMVQPPAPDQAAIDASLKEAQQVLKVIQKLDNVPAEYHLAPLRKRLQQKSGDGGIVGLILQRYLEDWTATPKKPTEVEKRVIEAAWPKTGRAAATASLRQYIKELEQQRGAKN